MWLGVALTSVAGYREIASATRKLTIRVCRRTKTDRDDTEGISVFVAMSLLFPAASDLVGLFIP